METQKPRCEGCGNGLTLKRTCTRVTFHCPVCNAEYPLARFIHLMDDAMEEQLGGFRCDRV